MLKQKIKEKINDKILAENLRNFAKSYKISKENAYKGIDFVKIRQKINKIKNYQYEDIIKLYEQFKENVIKKGCNVFEAENADEANKYILEICKKHNSEVVVKSKSMTSEEIKLNDYLEKHGITPIETDLGEWILQLAKETPSHMVMPAIHMSRKQVAKLFEKLIKKPIDENNIEEMVKIARNKLREYYFKAKVGITGANVAVSETGTIGIVTNEGNARLSMTIPDVHIVILGYEKLVKSFKDALQIIRALPKSATGQIISTYVSWVSGLYDNGDKKKEVHFVFLDNGRLDLFKNNSLKEALKCIRCGSCANVCPVYEIVGGHVFGDTYVGAIGLILTAFYGEEEKANEIMKMCIGCKTCSVNCPSGIDLQKIISGINLKLTSKYKISPVKKIVYGKILNNPLVLKSAFKISSVLQKPLVKDGKIEKIPFKKELDFRTLPAVSGKTFSDFFQKVNKNDYKNNEKEVFFYPGCAIEYFYPQLGIAFVKLLKKAGYSIEIPKRMVCCGLPAIHAGDDKSAEKTVIKNLKYLAIDKDILVLCPSCGSTLKEEYAYFTEKYPQDFIKSSKIKNNVHSLSEFLKKHGLKLVYTAKYRVTYHAPCHQIRGLCFSSEEFLKNLVGDYFIPLTDSDKCCGFGGSFSFDFPEISEKILQNKLDNIRETDAEIVITDCPGCIMQIEGGLNKIGSTVRVMHLSDFIENYFKISS